MKKYINQSLLLFFSFAIVFMGCKQKDSSATPDSPEEPRTPVTVTSVSYEPLEESVDLNATSAYLQKNFVKSNLNGYIEKANIKFGDFVNRGETLFVLKTKEATAIGNSVNNLNPDFKFSGVNVIKANASGYVTELNHQAGDYVQDGEQLAAISDSRSFVFVMNVPYEDKQYVALGKQVQLTLPDGERLTATVQSSLPMVDSISQTQAVSLKVNSPHPIPVNLVAKVKIVKMAKTAGAILDKKAVLSDETLNTFWVMKLINDSTAVKVPIEKGIETNDNVEILSPKFSVQDKILLSGNYGLPDTALVIVNK
ncbi:MAG: efflux RND transporter periplasmic adaptor subunit [Bacteroidota bacterium]|nr:efflux RND transporter periplasmic adaptor subunit [Bacteroidota bacterium]